MLDAFERLPAELDDVHLVVVGDGRDRGAAVAARSGSGRAVLQLGTFAHDLLPAYHAAADAFVSPAVGQSFGIVLVEAMAAGVLWSAPTSTGTARWSATASRGSSSPERPGRPRRRARPRLATRSLASSLAEGRPGARRRVLVGRRPAAARSRLRAGAGPDGSSAHAG